MGLWLFLKPNPILLGLSQSPITRTFSGFFWLQHTWDLGLRSALFLSLGFYTMSRSGQPPDLKKYMDKQLQIKLNANRMVVGTLRGFDQFMNLVVDNTVEVNGNDKTDIGMVVIRGNSVVTVEALEPVSRTQ
ncbi:Small nuclear ribonucleoprotein like [Actinidia chinensis var. chinensis]|uniref:Small nuclear ribonucleoprotein G n=1 Tax=Actinidia chinensis var. chinensis TaxID=1590841 RepID=A0A2R6QW04_ACTCC|nr:Small nuclear ribonucleoprotein like [Actinidia chinensis var. chinensis]